LTFLSQMVTALNPVFTIGDQIAEVLRIHRKLAQRDAMRLGLDALAPVEIPDPAGRLSQYPHELLGGMRQRVMIAMAIRKSNGSKSSCSKCKPAVD
jgi:ABC-type microcin C transport system duplicated ATPase subunit YejF